MKNGRCSAACGEWHHPTPACSMHTTGKTPKRRRGGGGRRGRRRRTRSGAQVKVMVVRSGMKWDDREKERERGGGRKGDTEA